MANGLFDHLFGRSGLNAADARRAQQMEQQIQHHMQQLQNAALMAEKTWRAGTASAYASNALSHTNFSQNEGKTYQRDVYKVDPEKIKIGAAIQRLIDQLPMRLNLLLEHVRFAYTVDPHRNVRDNGQFLVKFKNGKELSFADIDSFPTDADVARIALEAP